VDSVDNTTKQQYNNTTKQHTPAATLISESEMGRMVLRTKVRGMTVRGMKEALDTVGGRAKGCVEHSTHHTRGNTLMEKNILVFLIIFQAASGAQRLKRSFELQIQTARRSFNLRIQTASDRTDLSS